jgi:hypothetical protein
MNVATRSADSMHTTTRFYELLLRVRPCQLAAASGRAENLFAHPPAMCPDPH